MVKIAVKTLNYVGYLIGCSTLGDWFGRFWWSLWGFIKDEDYRDEHPNMYTAKVLLLMVIGILLALAIIWYPLTKLMEWINNKIDEHFDKKKEDDFDVDDEFDFLN